MSNFKNDYVNYMKMQEINYKAPDKLKIYQNCLQSDTKKTFTWDKALKYASIMAVCAIMVIIVVRTNVIGYAYEGIVNLYNTYILKSKDAELKNIKIEEEGMIFEKTFSSVSKASEEYKLEIMESDLAYNWEDDYTVVLGYGTEDKINGIRIIAPYYIMGDLPVYKDMLVTPDETAHLNPLSHGIYGEDLYEGEKYQTPIYLSMYVNVSGEHMDYGTQGEYVGVEVLTESYVSSANNVNCQIVSREFMLEEDIDELNPMVIATFVKDDVAYRLEGRVTVETMKEIVDSFEYMK